jgi:hypothetical protein
MSVDEPEMPDEQERPAVIIIPDDCGDLAVCDFDMFFTNLIEGIPLDANILDATLDTLDIGDRDHVKRIRQLNATGDGDAYWGLS